MAVCDFTQTITNQPITIDDYIPLYEMQYSNSIVKDRFLKFRSLDFFRNEVQALDTNGLDVSQSIRIKFEKWQDPFEHVQIEPVVYKNGVVCPPVVDNTCPDECIETKIEYDVCDVQLDKKYTVGITRCVTDAVFTPDSIEQLFNRAVEYKAEVMSIVTWNKLICEAIANPSTVLNDSNCFTNHFFDAGTSSIYSTLSNVINYLMQVYGSQTLMSDWALIVHPEIERNLLAAGSDFHKYCDTGKATAWGNVDVFAAGGFRVMPAAPELWGMGTVVAPNTRSMMGGKNPWVSADGTQVYALFVSNRAVYTGIIPLTPRPVRMYPTCPEQKEGLQQTWMDYFKVLHPEEVFVVAFDRECIA